MPTRFQDLFNQSTKVVAQCEGCHHVDANAQCALWVHPADQWTKPGGCSSFTREDPDAKAGAPAPEPRAE